MDLLSLLLIWYVIFLFSTTLHEAAHAWAGMQMGDLTAYLGGQVTLDPIPHIRRERVGMIIVPLLTFILYKGMFMMGWASAPYDPNWANRYPKRATLMALAGPAANFLLILVSGVILKVGLSAGWFQVPTGWYRVPAIINIDHVVTSASGSAMGAAIATALSIMFSLNLILFLFNLMPIPPMDGSSVIPMFLSHEGALRFQHTMARFQFIGLLVAWHIFPRIFFPARDAFLLLLYSGAPSP